VLRCPSGLIPEQYHLGQQRRYRRTFDQRIRRLRGLSYAHLAFTTQTLGDADTVEIFAYGSVTTPAFASLNAAHSVRGGRNGAGGCGRSFTPTSPTAPPSGRAGRSGDSPSGEAPGHATSVVSDRGGKDACCGSGASCRQKPTGKSNMRALAIVIAALMPMAATPAAASQPATVERAAAYDITALRVEKLRLNSGACRNLAVTVRHNIPDGYYADVYFEVWRGPEYQETGSVYGDVASGTLSGTYLYCPYQGLGKFRVGPSEVSYASPNYGDTGEFRDDTQGSFLVKQDSTTRKFSASRSGRTVRLAATTRFYNSDASQWMRVPKGKVVRVQRQRVNGSWETVSRARVGNRGRVVASVTSRAKRTWRLMLVGSPRTWPSHTAAKRI
jgi:hypothetical protein